MGGGYVIPQQVTVNENVLESEFVPLCDGTTSSRSFTRKSELK